MGVAPNSLSSIHPVYSGINICNQNGCQTTLISDYSSSSKCLLVSECDIALGQYHSRECSSNQTETVCMCPTDLIGGEVQWCTTFSVIIQSLNIDCSALNEYASTLFVTAKPLNHTINHQGASKSTKLSTPVTGNLRSGSWSFQKCYMLTT